MIDMELVKIETQQLKKYLMSISDKQDDISIILNTHLHIEYWLEEFIKGNLRKPEKLFSSSRLTFIEKLSLAESLGFDLNDECGIADGIKKLNTIRNRIAHRLDYKLNKNDLKLLSSLKFSGLSQITEKEPKISLKEELLAFCFAVQGYVVGFLESKKENLT
jgi:hypothetical protein